MSRTPRLLAVPLLTASLAGCFKETDVGAALPAAGVTIQIDTLASGLEVPWDLDFAPDGRVFITERPGRIRVVDENGLREEPWYSFAGAVVASGEAGLMGIALAPDFASTGEVYVCVTLQSRRRDGELVNAVMRIGERDGVADRSNVVIGDLPASRFHAGCALGFGPDSALYVTTGDAQRPSRAGDPDSWFGKVLRVTRDGRPAPDNPDAGSPVWAGGFRNPQGLAWEGSTGQLFATEHGPSGFPDERFRRGHDELNAVRRGANHGWPAVAGTSEGDRFFPPLTVWDPAVAPSGLAFYDGPYEPWRGSLLVAALRGQQLIRVPVSRDEAAPDGRGVQPGRWRPGPQESVLDERFGRIRAVRTGPDGHLYITTSNRDGRGRVRPGDDLLLRLRPR